MPETLAYGKFGLRRSSIFMGFPFIGINLALELFAVCEHSP
jgi:hypothetical protein